MAELTKKEYNAISKFTLYLTKYFIQIKGDLYMEFEDESIISIEQIVQRFNDAEFDLNSDNFLN